MKKKCMWLVVFMCCVLLVHTTPVMAKEMQRNNPIPVTPYATYISSASISLQVIDGTAYISASLSGYSNATKATIKAELQEKKNGSWKTIKTFTKTKEGRVVGMEESYAVDEDYTHRVKATFTVYSGSSSESRIGYSAEI